MANCSATKNRGRLRLWALLFFVALALPSALLVYKAFDQLKWEAFHRHQLQAEEIALRIDQQFDALIRREDARTFTDFGFLTLVGDPSAEFLQRSPLADLPGKSDLPGLIGYFQVDADGVFTTPLLPRAGTNPLAVGIPSAELAERHALQQKIESILASNRLVDRRHAEHENRSAMLPGLGAQQRDQGRELSKSAPRFNREDEKRVTLSKRQQASIQEEKAELIAEDESTGPVSTRTYADGDRRTLSIPSQAGFDRLSMQQQSIANSLATDTISSQLGYKALGRPQPKSAEEPNLATASGAPPPPPTVKSRGIRKERNLAPEPAPLVPTAPEAVLTDTPASGTRVRIFESEIDPFDMSQLDSGQFVLFRRVWRDGERLIQGALIDARALTAGVMLPIFQDTALARISDLDASFRDEVLLAISANGSRSYSPGEDRLAGQLLYRTRLSAPLNELQLAFTLRQLDAGAGAWVVIWLSLILFLVLMIGTWLMYRLGARQLDLVQQQQSFIYAVSHELKTPLTSIRMYSEMLREGWAREDKRMTYYSYIHDESERLSRLINNVLQLSRMSQGTLGVELEPRSSRDLMELIRAKVSSQIEQAGFQLTEKCTEDLTIPVDPDALVQIIINLIDNALKFAANTQPKLIELGCSANPNGTVAFSVRDYGPGIPRRQVNKIFRLFYRLQNELTRSTQGTGIGLALVRELAEAMNAQVQVINRKPGVEFRIVFPPYTSRA